MANIRHFPDLRLPRHLLAPWSTLSVQGGKFFSAKDPLTWLTGPLLVSSASGSVLVMGTSVDLADGSEAFALSTCEFVGDMPRRMAKFTRPPLSNVEKLPPELQFLFDKGGALQGEIGLFHLPEWKRTPDGEIGVNWILLTNGRERILLFSDEAHPLSVAVTCSPEMISRARMRNGSTRIRL
jgi:hypothetical protein